MGDWRRFLIYALACAGIAASLLLPWWIGDGDTARLEITLRKLSICALGQCRSVEAQGAYGVIGVATFVYGWVALIGLVFGGVMPALTGQPTRGAAYGAAILYLLFAGLSYATLDVPPAVAAMLALRTHWPLWAGIGGALLALGGPILLGVIDSAQLGGGATKAPLPAAHVVPPARTERVTEPPLRALRTTEPPARAPRSIELPAEAPLPAARTQRTTEPPASVRRTTEPPAGRAQRTTAPPQPLPADLPLLPALPPVEAAAHSGLRFAIAIGEARDDGLLAVDEEGATRQLRWPDLGGVIARELRGAAPLERAMLVDLVPRGDRPLRFVTTGRLTFPGVDVADPREALRRLLGLARAMNPQVELEPATAAFLERGAPLPAWTMAELERYDARYRAS